MQRWGLDGRVDVRDSVHVLYRRMTCNFTYRSELTGFFSSESFRT